MPLASTDVEYRLSGGGSNTDPDAALGGVMSSTEITSGSLHNLFDVVSSSEASSGDTEYRCFYITNNYAGSPQITAENVTLWIQTVSPSTDTVCAIGLASEGANGTAATIANESTAPASVTFTSPTDQGSGLSLGNLAPGQFYAVWIRRVVSASASAYTNDGPLLRVSFDTAA
ncbi:MAG: hypothetical protein ACN2B6_12330 [Rickettsiales bacterium]